MLHELTLSGLTAKLAAKEVSSLEAMQACLDRIDAVDGQVNAFMSIDRDDALGQADAADAALAKGNTHAAQPLLGVPISLKDLFCAKGQPVNCSSKILGDFLSPYDGTVVRKLRDAGAVLFGRLALGTKQILQRDRHAEQRLSGVSVALGQGGIGGVRLAKRVIAVDAHEGVDLAIDGVDALEARLHRRA